MLNISRKPHLPYHVWYKKSASAFCGFGLLIKETKLGTLLWELQPCIVSLASWHYRWSNPITSTGLENPNGIALVLTSIKW